MMKLGDLVKYRGSTGRANDVKENCVGIVVGCVGEESMIKSKKESGVYHRAYEVMWSTPGGSRTLWHPHYKLKLLSECE